MTKLYTALIASLLNEDNVKSSAIFKKIINEKSTNLLCENANSKIAHVSNIDFDREEAELELKYDLKYSVPIEVVVYNGHYDSEDPEEFENDPEFEFTDSYVQIKFKAVIKMSADGNDPRDMAYNVRYVELNNDAYIISDSNDDYSFLSPEAFNAIYDDLIKKLGSEYGGSEGLFGHAYKIAEGYV